MTASCYPYLMLCQSEWHVKFEHRRERRSEEKSLGSLALVTTKRLDNKWTRLMRFYQARNILHEFHMSSSILTRTIPVLSLRNLKGGGTTEESWLRPLS